MRKQTYRKSTGVYDKHLNSDFSVYDDTLNPKHKSSVDILESRIVNEVGLALDEAEKLVMKKNADNYAFNVSNGEQNAFGKSAAAYTGGRQFPANTIDGLEGRLIKLAAEAGQTDTNFTISHFIDCDGIDTIEILSNNHTSSAADASSSDSSGSTAAISGTTTSLPTGTLSSSGLDSANTSGDYSSSSLDLTDTGTKPCKQINVGILTMLLLIAKIIKIIIKVVNILRITLNKVTRLAGQAGQRWINPAIIPEVISDVTGTVMALVYQNIGLMIQKLLAALNVKCWNNASLSTLSELMGVLGGCTNLMNSVCATTYSMASSKGSFRQAWQSMATAFQSALDNYKNGWADIGDQIADNFAEEFSPSNIAKNIVNSSSELSSAISSVQSQISTIMAAKDTVESLGTIGNNLGNALTTSSSQSKKNSAIDSVKGPHV